MRKEILKIEKNKFILQVVSDITPFLRKKIMRKENLLARGSLKRELWRKIGSTPLDFLLSLPEEQHSEY
ncbi:MAG: hypothetical protein DRJ47_06520 [Thermoprotei archaeon]|nr:MAG: hypothetical protein DRJ47_06520 [Thermoprotei archaeon]